MARKNNRGEIDQLERSVEDVASLTAELATNEHDVEAYTIALQSLQTRYHALTGHHYHIVKDEASHNKNRKV